MKTIGLTLYEMELTRGNEILMTAFRGTDEADARRQAKRAYYEYTIADCREVAP